MDNKTLGLLRDIPDLIPVVRNTFDKWSIRIINREDLPGKNYLSPNRKDFYKILLISGCSGVFTLGLNSYNINSPTLIFAHPDDIISWRRYSEKSSGYFCVFKKKLMNEHRWLKNIIDKNELFINKRHSVINISPDDLYELTQIFKLMQLECDKALPMYEDAIAAYLRLITIHCLRNVTYPEPDSVSEEFKHIHYFFELLHKETTNISCESPIRIKTVKEFAAELSLHPNYLNALLKKHTGQTVSSLINERLVEESKILLMHSNLSLREICYSMGFSEIPNFYSFFKKNTNTNPMEFRKNNHL